MTCTQWDVDCKFIVECNLDFDDLEAYIIDNDTELPIGLFHEIHYKLSKDLNIPLENYYRNGILECDIHIPFRSKGYYDPGRLYGPPEKCYPPEGDEERTLFGNCQVIIYDSSQKTIATITLSEKVSNELFDMLEEEIVKKDIGDVISDSQEDWRY